MNNYIMPTQSISSTFSSKTCLTPPLTSLSALILPFLLLFSCGTETPSPQPEKTTYTVTFEVNGGTTVAALQVEEGENVVKPADPTRKNYTFVGWYKEDTYTTLFKFTGEAEADTVTEAITLYAKWTEIPKFTVTFNSREGSAVAALQVEVGENVVKPTDPTRTSHTFEGWYKEDTYTTLFKFTGEAEADKVTEAITLYAKWTEIPKFTVTFNSGEGSAVVELKVEVGENVAKPTDPTRTGYIFVDWYKEDTYTTLFKFTGEAEADTVTEAITLYAKWEVAGVTSTSSIKMLSEYQHVIQYLMNADEYNRWIVNDAFSKDDEARKSLIKKVYLEFNDAFDFIFLVLNEEDIPPNLGYYGQLIAVSNHIRGIGIDEYDNTRAYGSNGHLKSIMILTTKDGILSGPSLHELMHNWANFAINTTDVRPNDAGGFHNYNAKPHWGFTGGSDNGQLGGFNQSSLQDNIDGNPKKYRVLRFGGFANGGNSYPYTELELYLMGLIPIAKVEPFDVFSDITSVEYNGETNKITFIATERKRYGTTEILNDCGGARVPSVENSQKEFRLLTVILTKTELVNTEFDFFDKQVARFAKKGNDNIHSAYNFWEATGGRASINAGDLMSEKKTN